MPHQRDVLSQGTASPVHLSHRLPEASQDLDPSDYEQPGDGVAAAAPLLAQADQPIPRTEEEP